MPPTRSPGQVGGQDLFEASEVAGLCRVEERQEQALLRDRTDDGAFVGAEAPVSTADQLSCADRTDVEELRDLR